MNAPANFGTIERTLLPVVEILKILADSGAASWALFPLELADVVDPLQVFAELAGLVHAIGQDSVQEILADAFEPYRILELSEPEEIPLAPEPQPLLPATRRYHTPEATRNAFWYVASLDDPEYLKRWLADHPRDVATLQKLWEAKHACA